MKCMSPIYVRKQKQFVPCGRCAFCLNRKINGWVLRLRHEMAVSSAAHFITLTYADSGLHLQPGHDLLDKRDLQLFFKRLRKENEGIRYFAVGEYGTKNGRPHYHVLLFNLVDLDLVTKNWPWGHIKGERMTVGRIQYTVKYCLGVIDCAMLVKPFSLMSRNPGIGTAYIEQMGKWHRSRSDCVVYDFDTPNAMPRFYMDKIFDTPGARRYIHMLRMKHSEEHPQVTCPVEHDRLWAKLNRKNK